MRADGSYEQAEKESIFDNALLASPLGSPDPTQSFDPYNNSIVSVVIGVAWYRVVKHRTHAKRGLVIALVACALGAVLVVAVIESWRP